MTLKGCCCTDLKTGATIVGVLELIGSSIVILFTIYGFLVVGAYAAQDGPLQPHVDDSVNTLVIVLAVLLVINILNMSASSLLIHGIKTDKPDLMLFYLVELALRIVALFVCLVLSVGSSASDPHHHLTLASFLMQSVYFFLVVQSYRKQLKKRAGSGWALLEVTVDSDPSQSDATMEAVKKEGAQPSQSDATMEAVKEKGAQRSQSDATMEAVKKEGAQG